MNKRISQFKTWWQTANPVQRGGVWVVGVAAALVLVSLIIKNVSVMREERARKKEMAAGPRIQVAIAAPSPKTRTLVLVGEARPYRSVTLYAKISGYLKSVRVDKGDKVSAGDLLAVIEAPEASQNYDGAVADAKNKQAIADRYKPLLAQKLVSQQEADQAFADASVATAQAQSLGALKGYQEIRAPFDGMVTARYPDPGALVQNAENSGAGALPLFTVSQVDRLRIYVYVDQGDAASIHKGLPVMLTLDERPDVRLNASVTRVSGELDSRTRTLLTEIDVDNSSGTLVAGSYVKVLMSVDAPSYLQIPSEALVLRQTKNFVAVVTSSNTLTYLPVTVADNDGEHLRLLDGISNGDRVALNVGDSLDEGARVRPIALPTAPPTPAIK